MKAKIVLLALLLLSFQQAIRAQDKGLTLLLGPSVNLYYGNPNTQFVYSTQRLSWQFNGQFGFISTRGGTNRGNMLGLFATAGNTNPAMLSLMKAGGAEMQGSLNTDKKFNGFFNLEGGMVIARFLRMSGGIGRQYYTHDSIVQGMLKYYSGTLGFAFDLGVVNWAIDCQLMAGKDLNQNAIRLSTGFMVKF
jgi:hypothetical protein